MRFRFWFLVFALGLPAVSQAALFRVLLTSFDPFGGSVSNNTQPIVATLAKNAGQLGHDVTVTTCNLPVVYDRAASVAEECIRKAQPDVVVSFGEAACQLRIETAATNLDDAPGFPDNAGQTYRKHVILANAPERVGFRFPIPAMACALSPFSKSVQLSISAGGFVCNNLAYSLSSDLSARGIPFTFIHVPNSRCSAVDKDVRSNVAQILPMLRGAISALRSDPKSVDPKSVETMPTDRSSAQAFVEKVKAEKRPACFVHFAQGLLTHY